MIRALAAVALLLAGCSRSSGGPLEPVEAPGVQLSEGADGERTVTVQTGAVSARVTANWSDTAGQSVRVVYVNTGTTLVRLELGPLTMIGPAGKAVVMSVADLTNINRQDKRTDNDDARSVLQRDYSGIASGMLELPAGAERRVMAQLSPFSNTTAAAAGDEVTLRLPMPKAPRDIRFVARRPSLLPF